MSGATEHPGEPLARALAECGCIVSAEEAARLAEKLLAHIRAGLLVSPAETLPPAPLGGDAA